MLVSTTLAGPGAEASIVDALRSAAPLVDQHLILISGAEKNALYGAVYDANVRNTVFREYAWPNDYGAARTEVLRWAEARGATWALTVDCDERINVAPWALSELQNPNYDAFTVTDRDLPYQKPRFLRCGAGLYWEGECAERLLKNVQFPFPGQPPAMARMEGEFWELPKDHAAEVRRAERGIAAMPKILAKGEDAHARRHLAECLLTLGRPEEARDHFFIVAEGPGPTPDFERTWCRYRCAEFACVDGDFRKAREIAALALAEDPGLIQELGWVLAHSAAMLKDYSNAALWASYVLMAPIDYSRGGHRSKTWKDGATKLLANIEAAANRQRPQQMTAQHFAARAEFAPDYAILARALVETLSFADCLDLGAGTGLLVGALRDIGVIAGGIEASSEACLTTRDEVRPSIDFAQPLERWKNWIKVDLVSCVEVAEHIPAEHADELVDAVCSNARRWVYFSAAAPGQGGVGHVNEQPQGYWIEKFAARGWRVDFESTRHLVDKLAACRRCWWLQRNALIFKPSLTQARRSY